MFLDWWGQVTVIKLEEERTMDTQLDWDLALDSVAGDEELLNDVVSAIIEECPKCLEELDNAVLNNDPELLSRTAHTIKGNFRLFGPLEAVEVAGKIEAIGANGSCDNAGEHIPEMERLANRILEQLKVRIG